MALNTSTQMNLANLIYNMPAGSVDQALDLINEAEAKEPTLNFFERYQKSRMADHLSPMMQGFYARSIPLKEPQVLTLKDAVLSAERVDSLKNSGSLVLYDPKEWKTACAQNYIPPRIALDLDTGKLVAPSNLNIPERSNDFCSIMGRICNEAYMVMESYGPVAAMQYALSASRAQFMKFTD